MRYIEKKTAPTVFIEWLHKISPDWQPSFSNMSKIVKHGLKVALIEEQLGLCCYCESKLKEQDSHIEHLRPQTLFPDLALDYNNMLCSCQANLKRGAPRHCGNAKGDWFDEEKLISPLDRNCASHFRFTGDGHIKPNKEEDIAAKKTIEYLALDIPKLVDSRQRVLTAFLDENISDEEFRNFYNAYFNAPSALNPPEYISAILDVFSGQEHSL